MNHDSQQTILETMACYQIATSFSTYDSGLAFALEAGYASAAADYDAKVREIEDHEAR